MRPVKNLLCADRRRRAPAPRPLDASRAPLPAEIAIRIWTPPLIG